MSLNAHKKTAVAQIYELYYSTTYQALWDREPQIRQASPDRVANMLAWETGMLCFSRGSRNLSPGYFKT